MSDLKAALTEAVTNALESRQLVQHAQIRAAVAEVAIDVLLAMPGVAFTALPEPAMDEPDIRCNGCVGCPDPWNCK